MIIFMKIDPVQQAQYRFGPNPHPKFYWFDPGVARAAAGLLDEPAEKE